MLFLVSNTSDGCAFTQARNITEFDYNGSTYYLRAAKNSRPNTGISSKLKDMTSYTDSQYIDAATALLDYYYYVTD